MEKLYVILCLTGIGFQLLGQTFTVETVPNPKNKGSGYISDATNIFTDAEKEDLNRTIAAIEDSSTVEIAIVMLPSIGKENPKDFTYKLLNKWGVGKDDKDNGLLILTVLDQKRTEFEPGYGLEPVLPDITCYQIGQMLIPHFGQQDFGKGMKVALDAISDVVLLPENVAYVKSEGSSNKQSNKSSFFLTLLNIYALINLLFHLVYFYLLYQNKRSKQEYYDRYKLLMKIHWYVPLFFLPIPYLFVFFWVKKRLKHLRTAPRFAKKNGKPLRLLNEAEEDPYLEEGQITEEDIGSVDYDVWVSNDDSEILILCYDRLYSKYKKCTNCNYKTFYKSHSETINEATHNSTGLREDYFECKNCHFQKAKQTVLSKIKDSDSDDSKHGYSAKKRSRSRNFSSGSSKGKSFGNASFGSGSSGGGGAGVSW